MTTQKPELLPCPFCGVVPTLQRGNNGSEHESYDANIECENENCLVVVGLTYSDTYSDDAAIAAWNTRAATQPPQATDAQRKAALKDLEGWDAFRGKDRAASFLCSHLKILYAALQSPAVPIWKPIETAPHNRTLLLTFNFQSVYAGHYDGDGVWLDQNWEVPKPTHWSEFPISEQALAMLGGKE